MRLLTAAMAMGLFTACTGGDTGITELHPSIALSHDIMDYGEQPVFTPAYMDLFITNGGRAVSDVTIEISGDGFTTDVLEMPVAASDSWAVPIAFKPTTFIDYDATLTVFSDDPDNPELTVQLLGMGVPAPVPDIAVDPNVLDFGSVPPSAPVLLFVNVANEGTAPLNLGSLTQEGSGQFVMASDPSFGVVAPDTSIPIVITYNPILTDGDSGKLFIPSDDPDEPIIEVLLLGNGGGDFEYPVANIDCPGTAQPPQFVSLDGSASSDPGGLSLDYAWTISRMPPGSSTSLSTLVGDSTNFFADVAGEFEVQLVVKNSLGVSSTPAKCLIDAVPEDELHIELTWDTTKADLDLHLSLEDTEFFQKPGDCNFCNPNPNWNGGGSDNDCRLDIDDRTGKGPENINVQFPDNGSYDVVVHYFDDHGDDEVEATVRVYTYGVLSQEVSKIMIRNEVWQVGQANMPSGSFGISAAPLTEAIDRTCW